MTLGDVLDVVITYGEMKREENEYYEKERNKKNKNKTSSTSTPKSEKFSFGRAPELDTGFFKF